MEIEIESAQRDVYIDKKRVGKLVRDRKTGEWFAHRGDDDVMGPIAVDDVDDLEAAARWMAGVE